MENTHFSLTLPSLFSILIPRGKMKKTLTQKLICFILCGFLYLMLLCCALWVLYALTPKEVLFYTPYAIFIGALIAIIIWYQWQKDIFETLLVFFCYITAGFSFVFLAPYAVDRSLSTFIFFYAVEHDGYPQNSLSDKYMEQFYQRRLEDGTNGGFLIKEDNLYKPTLRAKIYYNLMYPIGIATNSLKNYQIFKTEIQQLNKGIND